MNGIIIYLIISSYSENTLLPYKHPSNVRLNDRRQVYVYEHTAPSFGRTIIKGSMLFALWLSNYSSQLLPFCITLLLSMIDCVHAWSILLIKLVRKVFGERESTFSACMLIILKNAVTVPVSCYYVCVISIRLKRLQNTSLVDTYRNTSLIPINKFFCQCNW